MKIAILCHSSAGGSGVVATELALSLASLGHTVHMVATQMPFRLSGARLPRSSPDPSGLETSGEVYFHQIEGATYPLFNEPQTSLAAVNTLVQVIEEYDVELVHAHYAIPHATSALLARDIVGRDVKVVTTLHGTDVTLVGLEPAFLRTTMHAIEASDKVTAVSQYLADHTHTAFGITRPIDVVYNWVDLDRFRPIRDPGYRARFASKDEAIVMHASNFRNVKRPEDVVRTFAGIVAQRPARLLMAGEGPERPRCLELARQLGVADKVHFLGAFPILETVLGVADLFLLPSSEESFGLVALEAMACGVPVVASNAGGIPEVVADGETGFVHPIGDVNAMIASSVEVLEPEHRFEMGERARIRAFKHFRPGLILPQYLEIYRRALETSKG
jgi:L-malate glycosyltransferase